MGDVDWQALRDAARKMVDRAHAPYSRLQVGAAALVDDGRIVTGCNVENASFGLSLCAECGLVSALHAGGGGRLLALVVVAGDGRPLAPCGRCRQLLHEAGGPTLAIDGFGSLGALLPSAFGPDDVAGRAAP